MSLQRTTTTTATATATADVHPARIDETPYATIPRPVRSARFLERRSARAGAGVFDPPSPWPVVSRAGQHVAAECQHRGRHHATDPRTTP